MSKMDKPFTEEQIAVAMHSPQQTRTSQQRTYWYEALRRAWRPKSPHPLGLSRVAVGKRRDKAIKAFERGHYHTVWQRIKYLFLGHF